VASNKDPEIDATLQPRRASATGLQQLLVRIHARTESVTMPNLPVQLVATKDVLPNTTFKTPLLGLIFMYPSYSSIALCPVESVFPE